MKVLVFDEWLPWPLESGKKIRSYNLLARLAKRHRIVYLAYVSPAEAGKVELLSEWCHAVVAVPDRRVEKWKLPFYLKVAGNIFSSDPFSTSYHVTPEFAARLLETVRAEQPDLVHCEWSNYAPFLAHLRRLPAVIACHNVESDIWKRLLHSSNNPVKKMIAAQQARRIEALERYWYPRVEGCIAVTPEDERVLAGYGAKVALVENGVDLGYYQNAGESHADRLIFTASFDTFSNQDGARYFLEEIYPLIRKERPSVRLSLVGKEPPRWLRRYGEIDAGVTVTGTVPDVRPFISQASVCVVPLRIGGGSRLKILEALAMKRPVVSTTIGAEGLRVSDGSSIVLADEPRTFAARVLDLLASSAARDRLVAAGYQVVRQHYDWEILAERQHLAWQEAVRGSSPKGVEK